MSSKTLLWAVCIISITAMAPVANAVELSTLDVGADAAPGTAEALYDVATGEVFFDVGTGIGIVGIMSAGMYHGNVDTGSIFGAPPQNSGTILAYFSPNGLPSGKDSLGFVLPPELTQEDIHFAYAPIGGQTVYPPVTMIVPEPSTIAMTLVVLGFLGVFCRRRRT